MKKKDKENQSENVMLEEDDCEFEYGSCPYCDNELRKIEDLYMCMVCDACFVVNDEGELVLAERYVDPNEFWD